MTLDVRQRSPPPTRVTPWNHGLSRPVEPHGNTGGRAIVTTLKAARSRIRRSVGDEADCRLGMGLRAMRISTAMTSAVIPGIVAGVIYFVIAFVTGASAAAAVIGGVVVAAIAIVIGLVFRAAFKRRAAPGRK
jgi:hypothetical protein